MCPGGSGDSSPVSGGVIPPVTSHTLPRHLGPKGTGTRVLGGGEEGVQQPGAWVWASTAASWQGRCFLPSAPTTGI